MIRSILHAIAALPRFLRPVPGRQRIIMTLLVKNEAVLLEHNLRFHRAMGVEGFIVTDNNSTDRTPEIIEHYRQKGWILAALQEPGTDYRQKAWVHRMIELARHRFHADWIINADADEFWYAPSGSLADEVLHTRANVLRCEVIGMHPEEGRPFTEWRETAHAVPHREAMGLSPYSIFGAHTYKVMHRADGYLCISMGNHKVKMLPQWQCPARIRIYHYNHLGREAFVRKVVNGGEQLERNPSRHGGRHWRYFLKLHREGRLTEEYDRLVGNGFETELRHCGGLRTDDTMARCFAQLPDHTD